MAKKQKKTTTFEVPASLLGLPAPLIEAAVNEEGGLTLTIEGEWVAGSTTISRGKQSYTHFEYSTTEATGGAAEGS